MELQFNKTVCPCLRTVVSKEQTQELTQELRLTDMMPDIGRILGCWGQILIRGKEWRNGSMSVSGGVMAWVLYAPEDGSAPQSVDAWIPFQQKWDIPDTQRDGIIRVFPYLKGMDSRSISARKMMIRAGIGLVGDALVPEDTDIFTVEHVPDDIQLRKQTYPMVIPQEAGEKAFQLSDEVLLPGNLPRVHKIIRYELMPIAAEQRVMAGKLVFRGACNIHILYASEDGMLFTWDHEMTFSQFVDLDRDYGPNASADIDIVTTGMEIDRDDEGKLLIKCGFSAQYVVLDRCMVEVVDDAYSNRRQVKMQCQDLHLPVRLDEIKETIPYRHTLKAEGLNVVDAACFWGYPMIRQTGDEAEIAFDAQFQVLYMGENDTLQSVTGSAENKWQVNTDRDNRMQVQFHAQRPEAEFGPDGIILDGTLSAKAAVCMERGIPMVTAIEFGELQEPDPARPSLILRRLEDHSLWDLAKACGSTVDAIYKANMLQQEPVEDRVLLIPVN